MKTVIGVLCVIFAAQCVTAQCPSLKTYTTELKPACDINDIYIKWPNYANQSSYYTCFGVGNPVLTPCPSGDYFTYVYQQCNQCSDYIPAPICENLKTQNTPNCVPIDSDDSGSNNSTATASTASTATTGYPTPNYPSTTSTASTTTTTTTTKAPTVETTASTNTTATTTTTTTVITPPTVSPTSAPTPSADTTYPGPPSPVTSAPNVPTPPTPAATPPVIDLTPPSA